MKKEISPNARIPFFAGAMALTMCRMALVLAFLGLSFAMSSPSAFADDGDSVAETALDSHENRSTENKTPIDLQTVPERFVGAAREGSFAHALVSGVGALALVLCVFFGLVYLAKILTPKRRRKLSCSLEVIDSCFVDSKSELITVRWGGKLILVARSSGNWTPLSEVSNPEDVDRFLKENASDNDDGGKTERSFFLKPLKNKSRVNDENQKH